jgi:hypothetical protein
MPYFTNLLSKWHVTSEKEILRMVSKVLPLQNLQGYYWGQQGSGDSMPHLLSFLLHVDPCVLIAAAAAVLLLGGILLLFCAVLTAAAEKLRNALHAAAAAVGAAAGEWLRLHGVWLLPQLCWERRMLGGCDENVGQHARPWETGRQGRSNLQGRCAAVA